MRVPPTIPPAGPHGGDRSAVAAALEVPASSILDLSASLNPFAPDVDALIPDHLAGVGAYPDDRRATAALAEALGVDVSRLVLTNGGSEAIALVAQELGSGRIVEPEFSLYRRHLARVDYESGRWRSNPSNPLGQVAGSHEVASVWDEAFYPLTTASWSRGDEGSWRLGSLTKLWACPGIRMGFAIAPDEAAASSIRRRQLGPDRGRR